jgi:hypothetical protein
LGASSTLFPFEAALHLHYSEEPFMNHRTWVSALVLVCRSTSVKADEPKAPTITVPLRREPFPIYDFVPTGLPKAIIIFGSGDGSWGQVENRVCTLATKFPMNIAIRGLSKVGKDTEKEWRGTFWTLDIQQTKQLYEKFSDHPLRYPAWLKFSWTTKG